LVEKRALASVVETAERWLGPAADETGGRAYPAAVSTGSGSDLRVERSGSAVTVTFDRPHKHNAFTQAMYAELRELCAGLAEDTSTTMLVLRGAGGRAFAAGNEISDFLERDAVAYEDWIRELLEALMALPQVTVAAVDGVCVGGGLAVATHCDLRVATRQSRFGYPIARTLGNALAASIVYRCATVMGEPLTREMLLAARLVDAERAWGVGALAALVEDADGLDAEVAALVDGASRLSSVTIAATKQQLLARARSLEAAPAGDDDLLREVYTGSDFTEGVRAFLAKERPRFGR
jgi:enoyl-CoA hydratase/carnithine racemase